jgi:predicted secreted protein
MTLAKAGYGTVLQRGDGGGPETFTTIAELINIDGPVFKMDTADATNQSSPNAYKEFIGTLLEAGEISTEVNLIEQSATQRNLITDLNNRTLRNFKVVCNDVSVTTFAFAALVTEFGAKFPVAGKKTASLKLKISGPVTITP